MSPCDGIRGTFQIGAFELCFFKGRAGYYLVLVLHLTPFLATLATGTHIKVRKPHKAIFYALGPLNHAARTHTHMHTYTHTIIARTLSDREKLFLKVFSPIRPVLTSDKDFNIQ